MQDPNRVSYMDVCPAAHPEVFRLLDLACEAGIIEKVIGYKLTDAAIKVFKAENNKSCKKANCKK